MTALVAPVDPDSLTMAGVAAGDLEGRTVAVLGFARSGIALARFLVDAGARVRVYDRRPADELAEAVRALGPEGSATREVWRLMYVEDRTVTEVAGLMGVPEGTVKSRAHRVRQLMRAVLRQPVRDGGG